MFAGGLFQAQVLHGQVACEPRQALSRQSLVSRGAQAVASLRELPLSCICLRWQIWQLLRLWKLLRCLSRSSCSVAASRRAGRAKHSRTWLDSPFA